MCIVRSPRCRVNRGQHRCDRQGKGTSVRPGSRSGAKVRDGSCVTSNAGPHGGCVTVREMKEGPSGSSAIRSLIPSHCKLLSSSAGGERCRKVGTMIPAGKVERGERKQTASEA